MNLNALLIGKNIDPRETVRLEVLMRWIPRSLGAAVLPDHEIRGRKNSVALRPGYGRINQWSGSLDYELENGTYSMGFISRRDIADETRPLFDGSPPADKTISEFDEYLRGPGD